MNDNKKNNNITPGDHQGLDYVSLENMPVTFTSLSDDTDMAVSSDISTSTPDGFNANDEINATNEINTADDTVLKTVTTGGNPKTSTSEPTNTKSKKKIIIGILLFAVVLAGSAYVYTYHTQDIIDDVQEDDITSDVPPDTLLDWTLEAEDELDIYTDDSLEEEDSDMDGSSSSNDNSSSNNSSNNGSSSNNSSNNDSSNNSDSSNETLGKGDYLIKHYDGGTLHFFADGSVFDMTRNIWWTKTQWKEFMTDITVS